MKQEPVQKFISACGKAIAFVENDMPIGLFHDFLMQLKGMMVERMVAAQKQHEEEAKAAMSDAVPAPEAPACTATEDCAHKE